VKPTVEHDGIAIYQGEALRLLHQLEDLEHVGAVITDPPYSSGGMMRSDRNQKVQEKYLEKVDVPGFHGDSRDQRSYATWLGQWLSACWEKCDEGAFVFVFTDWRQLPTVTDGIQAGGFIWRGIITWARFRQDVEFIAWGTKGVHKSEARGISPSSIQYCPSIPQRQRLHMTEKPQPLLASLMAVLPPDTLVLDPFMGAGSTLIAARDMGHRVIGIELEPLFVEKAGERLRQRPLPLVIPSEPPSGDLQPGELFPKPSVCAECNGTGRVEIKTKMGTDLVDCQACVEEIETTHNVDAAGEPIGFDDRVCPCCGLVLGSGEIQCDGETCLTEGEEVEF
jgi:site-specific DNA-methyltransferase (adenine-specific)